MKRFLSICTMSSLFALLGCDTELGPPDTDAVAYLPLGTVEGDPQDEFKDGPDPYEEGEQRLSLGIFYEGGYSDTYEIDNDNASFFIYSTTFTIEAVSECTEGTYSEEIRHLGKGWFGGGVHFGDNQDLSAWDTMHLSLWSESSSIEGLKIHMKSVEEGKLPASAYGFAADGEWHHIAIPLADFAEQGVDLTDIEVALMLILEGGSADDTFRVDNVYFTAGDSE